MAMERRGYLLPENILPCLVYKDKSSWDAIMKVHIPCTYVGNFDALPATFIIIRTGNTKEDVSALETMCA